MAPSPTWSCRLLATQPPWAITAQASPRGTAQRSPHCLRLQPSASPNPTSGRVLLTSPGSTWREYSTPCRRSSRSASSKSSTSRAYLGEKQSCRPESLGHGHGKEAQLSRRESLATERTLPIQALQMQAAKKVHAARSRPGRVDTQRSMASAEQVETSRASLEAQLCAPHQVAPSPDEPSLRLAGISVLCGWGVGGQPRQRRAAVLGSAGCQTLAPTGEGVSP